LWEKAYKIADRIVSGKVSPLVVVFSKNPYLKTAYKQAVAESKYYKQRNKIFRDIKAGKVTDVAIINGRITNTKTGTYLTPAQVSNKQFADLVRNDLQLGEKLIVDPKTYNIKGIESNLLKRTIPYNKTAIEAYSKKVANIPNIRQMAADIAARKQSVRTGTVSTGPINIFSYKSWKDFIKSVPQSPVVGKIDRAVIKPINKLFGFAKSQRSPWQVQLDNYTSNFWKKFGRQSQKGAIVIRNKLNKVREKQMGKLKPLFKKDREQMEAMSTFIRNNPGLPDRVIIDSMKANGIIKNREDAVKTIFHLGQYIAATFITSLIDLGLATPSLISAFKKAPLTSLLSLPPALIEGLKQDYKRVRSGDPFQVMDLVVEYYALSKVFKLVGGLTKPATAKLSNLVPGTKKIIKGKILLRKAPKEIFKVRGKQRFLLKRVQRPSLKRPFETVSDFLKGRKPGQFKKFTKDPGLILKTQTVKSESTPLSRQAQLAGQEITAVNAAADQITSWLKRKKVIRKPIPNESKFPIKIKELLNNFDSGKRLTTKEFAKINLWLQKNVAPNITLLERSLYANPASGLRLSRLGITAERTATLRDIMKGNFKLFGTQRPQILVFENVKVAKFPKSLRDVQKTLLSGKKLTTPQTNRLIRWQVKTGSGKFKPIGSTIYQGGIELEVTLAPGEMIKRINKLGSVIIEGKRVSIVSAEVFKPSKALLKQIKLANLGRLKPSALQKLERLLSKKLGKKIQIETPTNARRLARQRLREARRLNPNIPVLRVRGPAITVLTPKQVRLRNSNIKSTRKASLRKRKKITVRKRRKALPRKKRLVRKPIPRKKNPVRRKPRKRKQRKKRPTRPRPKSRPRPRGRVRPRPTLRSKPRGKPRPTPRPRPGKPTKRLEPKPRLAQKFGKRKLKKKRPGYYIVIRRRGKKIKLNRKPLVMKDAKDYLAYKIDRGLSRTAWFEPMGKQGKVIRLPKQIKGYFLRNKKKLRPYKIRTGKKKALRRGYIEKRKYIADTKSEKRLLVKARKRRKVRRPRRKVRRRRRK